MTAPRTAADEGQFPLIDAFPGWLAGVPAPDVVLGPGDDCALLQAPPPGGVALTTDVQVEGVHYQRDWCTPADVGWRALAAAASDVAAMGGRPMGAVVALAVPAETPVADLREFSRGLRESGLAHGCPVVGGNLATALGGWHVATTVLGTAGPGWRRAGARPGDVLWLTGYPARAHAGWQALVHGVDPASPGVADALAAFRRPRARFAALPPLLAAGAVHAAIDLSDGLSRCAERIATASGTGLVLDAVRLPHDPVAAAVAAALGADPAPWTLHGGESYELLLAAPPGGLHAAAAALVGAGLPCVAIGHITRESGVRVRDARGGERPLPPDGFRHFGGA